MTLYEKCKKIVTNKQYEEIDGYLIDMTSANLYCKVWEGLSNPNREKLETLNTASAIMMCWKLIK